MNNQFSSNCCDALIINGDVCSSCKEHCEAVDNTEAEITGDDDHLSTVPEVFAGYFGKEIIL